ncbi:hypothetical protein D3C72_1766800 [compost metagenome]
MLVHLIGGQIGCDTCFNRQISSRFGSLDRRTKQARREFLTSELRQDEELDNTCMRIDAADPYMASVYRSLNMILQD